MESLNNLLHSANESDLRQFVELVAEEVYKKIKSDDDSEKLYTAKEIIVKAGISKATLERRLRDGMQYISAGKKKKRFFRIKDVENFKLKRK